MARIKGFRSSKIAPYPADLVPTEGPSGAFTAEATALSRTPPLAEELFAGNQREDSASDFGADVSASADQAASTELP